MNSFFLVSKSNKAFRILVFFAVVFFTPGKLFSWTDNPVHAGSTPVKKTHIEELRTAINSKRQVCGVSPANYPWTDPTLKDVSQTKPTFIRATHINELRTAVKEAYTNAKAGRVIKAPSKNTFKDEQIFPNQTRIRAVHITELRDYNDTLCCCTEWENKKCGAAGGCGSTSRNQTRICDLESCASTSQCVEDLTCTPPLFQAVTMGPACSSENGYPVTCCWGGGSCAVFSCEFSKDPTTQVVSVKYSYNRESDNVHGPHNITNVSVTGSTTSVTATYGGYGGCSATLNGSGTYDYKVWAHDYVYNGSQPTSPDKTITGVFSF